MFYKIIERLSDELLRLKAIKVFSCVVRWWTFPHRLLPRIISRESGEQNKLPNAECISSCVELSAEYGDKALQPSYDPWVGVDFRDRAKIDADLTKTYKDVTVAANVDADAKVILPFGSPIELLPQKKHLAQRPRTDLGKISKAAAVKACVSKLRSSPPGSSGDAC